jgi:plasmid stabilization system protein ParE
MSTLLLRLTETLKTDLAEIWTYLALEASEATASRVIAAFRADLDRLMTFPLSGPPRERLAPRTTEIPHSEGLGAQRRASKDARTAQPLRPSRPLKRASQDEEP